MANKGNSLLVNMMAHYKHSVSQILDKCGNSVRFLQQLVNVATLFSNYWISAVVVAAWRMMMSLQGEVGVGGSCWNSRCSVALVEEGAGCVAVAAAVVVVPCAESCGWWGRWVGGGWTGGTVSRGIYRLGKCLNLLWRGDNNDAIHLYWILNRHLCKEKNSFLQTKGTFLIMSAEKSKNFH